MLESSNNYNCYLLYNLRFPVLAKSRSSDVRFRLLLEISTQLLFLPFLFSSHCCFVGACVVFGRSDYSLFAFFELSSSLFNRRTDTIFNIGESSSFFFSRHIHPVSVITVILGLMHRHEFACSLVHLFKFSRPL